MSRDGKMLAGLIALGGLVMFLLSPAGSAAGVRRLSRSEITALAGNTVAAYFPAVDPKMLVAIAQVESNGYVRAFRNEPQIADASAGLMQTLLGTAQWMWDTGYTAAGNRPDRYELLFDPAVSMYYAAAFINTLRSWAGQSRSEEFIVRAYNGGPGNAMSGATAPYWQKYLNAKNGG